MSDSSQKEPSMEEILASIRRIISEDGDEEAQSKDEEPKAAPEPDPEPEAPLELEEEEPLELVDEIEEEPGPEPEPEPEIEPEPEPEPEPAPPPELELVDMEDQDPFDDDEDDFFEPPPPPPPAPSRRSQPLEDYDDDRIVSDATEAFGVASFAKLERSIRMGHSGETLEDVVKNLLRPMLRSWLDENLPGMVERMVEDEIRNMASGAKRRWDDDDY